MQPYKRNTATNMTFDYYAAPDQKIFDEIKAGAIAIWLGYDKPEQKTYREEKLARVEPLENVSDNAWYILAMFDKINQAKLIRLVSEETANHIRAIQML